MAKVIAKLKTKEDFINKYSCLKSDIILSDLSKRNGFVKGIADYGFIKKFGIVRIPFQYAYNEEDYFEDWTYEDGEKIPHEIYIWETIKWLNEEKLLNK
jgi:hypothetical protein